MAEPLTRRSFLTRASGVALTGLALVAGVGRERASAHVSPPPCRVRCEPISKTGCACGGNLYRCSGCGNTVHVCATRDRFAPFCLRRVC
ncbi:MAG: twin-arginine translocation signal domain-containing protein [Actinomycetota bacterium]